MRHLLTSSCLLLLASTAGCELADEGDLGAELGPDGGVDGDEPDVGSSSSAVTNPKLHLYADIYYQGTEMIRSSYDSNFGNDGFNDRASSLINPTGYFWLLFEHTDYRGRKICMRPSSLLPNLRNIALGTTGYSWNDRISSVRRMGTTRSTCGDGTPVVGTRFEPSP